MPDERREKKKRIREQEMPDAGEVEAAPPDNGGHQGDFSRPEDQLQVRDRGHKRQGQEASEEGHGPPLVDDPQTKRRRRPKRIHGERS
jgi:hypothetical protein